HYTRAGYRRATPHSPTTTVHGTGPRIGISGGTFDPPHVDHLAAAVNVRHALALDVVLLFVANVPWQKVGARPVRPAADRLELVRLAVGDGDGLEVDAREMRRGGQSYTADTVTELLAEGPTRDLFA